MTNYPSLAQSIAGWEKNNGKNPQRFAKLVEALPKAEIHVHIESLVTPADLLKLNSKYDIYPDCRDEEDLKEALGIKKIANLSEMIQQFLTIQSFIRDEEDFALIGNSILPYMERNNIVYLEGRLAVSSFVKRDFDFDRMMGSLDRSLKDIADSTGRESAVFVDVSRTFGPENAMRNLDLLLAYLEKTESSRIIGIDLGGAEKSGEPATYAAVFDKAHEAGLRCVAHGGEESPPSQVRDTINYLKPERIGHGISAVQDDALMAELAALKLPLEVCPTSNIFTGAYVKSMEEHPIARLFAGGVIVTLNTDDPLLFEVELNQEYERVYKDTDLNFADMLTLLLNTVRASFLEDTAKKQLFKKIETKLYSELSKMVEDSTLS